jgi:ABC-type dipeptide/oligopeptide/nickel transport system ATPase component
MGMTLLLITHDRVLAERCGRVVRLADGQVVDAGAAEGAPVAPPSAAAGPVGA